MTLSSSRVGLKHRATIQRNQGTVDTWGGSSTNWQAHLTNLPCRAWGDTVREHTATGIDVVIVANGMIVPAGTDVVAISDRVLSVVDTDGNTILEGPMRIHGIIPRPGSMELVLEVTG